MHWSSERQGKWANRVLAALMVITPACGQWTAAQTTPSPTALGPAWKADQVGNAGAQGERDWWKNAVIYEVYPRSFQDSNGDGVGDLNGITQRLDYLKKLGVDAIWLTPVYPSPQVDFGYDISNYRTIDPQYGTLKDFDRLVAEASKRHIRVIMDMVMNHTSDQHPWFAESKSSKNNLYRDWYVWRNGKNETATDKGQPPNNWQSAFGHSAWQWDETTRQYYYHKYYIQQPDLNWRNPRVHEEFKDIVDYWLKKGVGGFRFDAIGALYEDPSLADEGVVKDANGNPGINAFGDPRLDGSKTGNQPGVHEVVQEIRAESDKFASERYPGTRVMIGETNARTMADLEKLYGTAEHPEFELPMDMQVGYTNKLDVAAFRTRISDAETKIGGNTPLLLFDNHDQPRMDLRYGDGFHDVEIQRALAAVLFASRGAALMYYGDEIGMKTIPPVRKEDVKDPVGLTGWPQNKGRDGERTPMQWDASAEAGFTSAAKPWLPVPPNATTINVKAEESDRDSLLKWYEALIKLKKTSAAMARGTNTMLDTENTHVLSWMRESQDEGRGAGRVVVSVNFTAEKQMVNLTGPELKAGPVQTLLKSPGETDPAGLERIALGPFGVFIGQVR